MINYFAIPGLKNLTSNQVRFPIDPNLIMSTVCNYYHLQISHLFERTKKRSIADARKMTAYLIKKYTSKSNSEIAALLRLDRTTILYAIVSMGELIQTNEKLANDYTEIRSRI